jgi:high-affinity iron transporter
MLLGTGIFVAALAVIAILVWQGIFAQGAPDPTQPNTSKTVAALDIGVLVFREGLECILVLAAITATMTGAKATHRKPVAAGAGVAFIATLITWFIAVGIVDSLSDNMRALDLQAATGLLAVVVLLIIMNWFFHKIYWGGWIRAHNRRRKTLLGNGHGSETAKRSLLWGLILLGFTSLYREGFEVVLFLQTYYLRFGSSVVLQGALLGIALSAIVAVLTFVLQQRLPYRKMLITTGILLGVVLLVMVGEQAQEMQLAHWISTTPIGALVPMIPRWAGLWFSVYPTYETLIAQGIAAVLVVGSYYAARKFGGATPPISDEPQREAKAEADIALPRRELQPVR